MEVKKGDHTQVNYQMPAPISTRVEGGLYIPKTERKRGEGKFTRRGGIVCQPSWVALSSRRVKERVAGSVPDVRGGGAKKGMVFWSLGDGEIPPVAPSEAL